MISTTELRSGPRYWLSSYLAMIRFDAASSRMWLPMLLGVQILMGAGMAMVYGFYLGRLSPAAALFIVTGAPTLSVITMGMVGVPAMVGERKMQGTWDYVWSLPVPRSASIASTFTVYTLLTIPGVVVTLVLAAWRYGLHLDVSPAVVPAFVLAALMASSMGFGLAQAIPNPLVTNLITNVLVFAVLMFSPVVFPKEQLPHWLATVHQWLPIYHLSVIVRASVTRGLVHDLARSYLILGAWTVAAWSAAAWVAGRRH